MKALPLLLVALVLVPSGLGASGKVGDDYVRVVVDPDFQYRSDEDVVVPIQVQAVKAGRPLEQPVKVFLKTEGGRQPITLPGGQAWLNQGIAPYPSIQYVNFGTLEAGLYRVLIEATAGGLKGQAYLEFGVILPPKTYEATLRPGSANDAEFHLKAHNDDVFQVTVYRDALGGRVVLESAMGSNVTLDVPYLPGDKTKVEVVGPNGWANAENKYRDPFSGSVTYPPWVWDPDYALAQNAQVRSPQNLAIVGGILLAMGAGVVWMVRNGAGKRRDAQ